MNCRLIVKHEQGQGLVEFAIVFPLFFMIILFIIEIGWMTYQQSVFDQGYQYSSWTITAAQLNDHDPINAVPSDTFYKGFVVEQALADEINKTNIWAFIPANLEITQAEAKLYNEKEMFKVPGRLPSTETEAASYTRYMELSAKLSYKVFPLTYFGELLFCSGSSNNFVTINKDISYKRVVGSQHRSE